MKKYLKAEVFSNDGSTPLGTSLQVSTQSDEKGHVLLILKSLKTDELTTSRLVQIIVYTERGIQFLKGSTTFILDNMQANFFITEWSDIVDRRENVKTAINVPTVITGVIDDYGELKALEPPYPITVKNISVGGMLFTCDTRLEIDSRYLFTFILNNVPIKIFFTIVRHDKNFTNDAFAYGCRFELLSPSIDSMLCSYIYQVQLNEKLMRAQNAK